MSASPEPPRIILHKSKGSHHQTIIEWLNSWKLPFIEVQFLAEISDKTVFNEIPLAIAEVNQETGAIEFLRSIMHYDHLIQRMLLTSDMNPDLLQQAINKAHINYYLPLPPDPVAFRLLITKAIKRYDDLTYPFRQYKILTRTTSSLFTDKEKFRQEATVDSLTGVLNRRAFFSILSSLWESGAPVAMAILDLDHFKSVNDTYGHAAGDKVLKTFGQILKKNLREGIDQAFRYGGEEFAILSVHKSEQDMTKLLERLMELVRALTVSYEQHTIRFTFSAGVAHSRQVQSHEQLVKAADEALYRAKRTGRDRICTAFSGTGKEG